MVWKSPYRGLRGQSWLWGCCFAVPLRWRHNGRDGVSNHQPNHCLLHRLFRNRSKKTSKLRVTGLCAGNSPVTCEFPAQMASNIEIVPFEDVIIARSDHKAIDRDNIRESLTPTIHTAPIITWCQQIWCIATNSLLIKSKLKFEGNLGGKYHIRLCPLSRRCARHF